MKYIVVLSVIIFSICSCSLDRSNPLDPKNNPDILVPNEVLGINLLVSPRTVANRWIKVTWQADTSERVDGYYIYRGMSRHSSFVRIAEINNKIIDEYYDREDIFSGNDYWYRISAYKEYPQGILEGRLSPITDRSGVRVN